MSNIFFDIEEAPGKKYLHMYVKELDPHMCLALHGRIGFLSDTLLSLCWQSVGAGHGSEHESVMMLDKPVNSFQSSWLVDTDDRASAI